jgi:hypothetical protein
VVWSKKVEVSSSTNGTEMLSERLERKKEKEKKAGHARNPGIVVSQVGAKEAVDSKKMRAVGYLGVLFCSRLDQTKEGNPKRRRRGPRAKRVHSNNAGTREREKRRRTVRAPRCRA